MHPRAYAYRRILFLARASSRIFTKLSTLGNPSVMIRGEKSSSSINRKIFSGITVILSPSLTPCFFLSRVFEYVLKPELLRLILLAATKNVSADRRSEKGQKSAGRAPLGDQWSSATLHRIQLIMKWNRAASSVHGSRRWRNFYRLLWAKVSLPVAGRCARKTCIEKFSCPRIVIIKRAFVFRISRQPRQYGARNDTRHIRREIMFARENNGVVARFLPFNYTQRNETQ